MDLIILAVFLLVHVFLAVFIAAAVIAGGIWLVSQIVFAVTGIEKKEKR